MLEPPKGVPGRMWLGRMLVFLVVVGLLAASQPALASESKPKNAVEQSRIPRKKLTGSKTGAKSSTDQKKTTSKSPSNTSSSGSKPSIHTKAGSANGSRSSNSAFQENSTSTRTVRHRRVPPSRALDPYRAAVVMEARSGRIVYSHEPHRKLVPASLTKMMLVLLVMEKVRLGALKLSEPVVASERTTGVGGTQIDLKSGEALPLEEMLQAILVRSANDAAASVAEHLAGSQAKCVELMNARARSLGMTDTTFVNVHGLPSSNGHDNVSTAYDMAILAKALLRYPEILRWSSQEVAYIRGGQYPIHSTNKLLGRCEGVDGLKTGFVRKAGFNIAATAARQDHRLIAVVMGSPSSETRNNAAAKLLSQGFERCVGTSQATPRKSPTKANAQNSVGRSRLQSYYEAAHGG